MASYQTIGVIGAGAWGTALAQSAAQAGRSVKIWAYEPEVVEAINTVHENTVFLPGAPLNPAITASSDPADLSDCDAFLMVAPAQHARGILKRFAPHIAQGASVLLCAKGFERESLALMTDVLRETVPHAIPAVLSGPSFAIDVAKGLPTAVTLACEDRDTGEALMEAVGSQTFRPYWSGDLVGAEVGGSVKNVLAIAAGIVEGRGTRRNPGRTVRAGRSGAHLFFAAIAQHVLWTGARAGPDARKRSGRAQGGHRRRHDGARRGGAGEDPRCRHAHLRRGGRGAGGPHQRR